MSAPFTKARVLRSLGIPQVALRKGLPTKDGWLWVGTVDSQVVVDVEPDGNGGWYVGWDDGSVERTFPKFSDARAWLDLIALTDSAERADAMFAQMVERGAK